jgi:hypothetical protein
MGSSDIWAGIKRRRLGDRQSLASYEDPFNSLRVGENPAARVAASNSIDPKRWTQLIASSLRGALIAIFAIRKKMSNV